MIRLAALEDAEALAGVQVRTWRYAYAAYVDPAKLSSEAERAERAAALTDAGVIAIVDSWQHLAGLLVPVLRHRAAGDLIRTGGVE